MASPVPDNIIREEASEVSTTRKRKLCFDDEPETVDMPSIKLPAAKVSRKLPAFMARHKYDGESPSPTESGNVSPGSSESSVEAETDKQILERTLDYLEKRISTVRADLKEGRFDSSQDSDSSMSLGSNRVSYSQDSRLSGDEPPMIELVVRIIIETLPEGRLESLFAFNQVKDMGLRLTMVVSQVNCDLLFFRELVNETLEGLLSPLGEGPPTCERNFSSRV